MQKTLLLFFLFISLSFSVFAQPGRPQQRQGDSIIEKVWFHKELTIRNNVGNIIEVTGWKNGKKHGERKLFKNDGKIREVSHYKHGLLNGKKLIYNYKDELSAEKNFKALPDENKSVLDGKSKQFQNGQLTFETEYENDKKTGRYKYYYPNGKIKEKGQYENGIKIGTVEAFDRKGTLVSHQEYIVKSFNGGKKTSVKDGHFLLFDTESNPIEDSYYKNGLKDGISKIYNREIHNLTSLNTYKKGKRHGAYEYYFDSGDLREIGNYYRKIEVDGETLKNVYNGERIQYHENGNLKSKANWENYHLKGVAKAFYKDAILASEAFYENGLKTGESKRWDDKGRPRNIANYKIILKDSVFTSVKDGLEKHWEDGKLYFAQEYDEGLKDGIGRSFYANGQVKRESHYQKDERNGIDKSFYKDGSLKSNETYRATHYGHELIGWGYKYDEKGKVTNQFYADAGGKKFIDYSFREGENLSFDVSQILRLEFLPAGKLKTFQLFYRRTLDFNFFSNGNLRMLKFSVPGTLRMAKANFSSEGKLLSVNEPEDAKLSSKEMNKRALKIQKQVNPQWIESDFIQDQAKTGSYKLNFSDGSTFLKLSFKDSLPQENWIIRNPIKNDTLFYAEFEHGKFMGKKIIKSLDGINKNRSLFDENGIIKKYLTFYPDGVLQQKSLHNPDGTKSIEVAYYKNGQLKEHQNLNNNTRIHKKENGNFRARTFLKIEGKDTTRIQETYYPEINQLQQRRIFQNSTKKGSVKTFYKNGQLQTFHELFNRKSDGLYQKFDENGNLIMEGHFKNKLRDGSWKEFKSGKIVKSYRYKKGEIIINQETEAPCACYDRSIRNDEIGFANGLDYIVSGFENVKAYLPSFIIPVENLNLKHTFVMGFNGNSGNRNTSFYQMKLLLYDELSFYLPANKQLKINLNPCRTEGYINNIRASFAYNPESEKLQTARFTNDKIAISLEKSPLKAEDTEEFTGLFDISAVTIRDKELKIDYKTDTNPCFAPGIINDFMHINIIEAKPIIQVEKNYGRGAVNYYQFPIIQAEAKDFYGFAVTEATVNFDFEQRGKTIPIQASTTELYASSKFVAGELKVKGKVINDTTFRLASNQQEIDLKTLKEFLSDHNFYRLKLETVAKEEVLKIYFFTE